MSSYATPADLAQLSMAAAAIGTISPTDQQAALDSASNTADGYLAASFVLPLQAPYSSELKQQVCNIASYRLLRRRGFSPQGKDSLIVQDYKDALQWLADVRDGKISPPGLIGSGGAVGDAAGAPMVQTDALRGWQTDPNTPGANVSGDPNDFSNFWD